MSTSKAFPICLAAFVLTGVDKTQPYDGQLWSTGFVVAGLVGAVFLLVSGVFLGAKGKALNRAPRDGEKQRGQPAPRLVPPRLVAALPIINIGIALSVAFDMVTKPEARVALSDRRRIALGAAMGIRRPAPVAEGARAS